MENGTESHWGLYVKTSKHPEEQENVDDKVASGFLIVSDWSRGLYPIHTSKTCFVKLVFTDWKS